MAPLAQKNNLYDLYGSIKPPKVGNLVEGIVVGGGRSSLYLDLGAIGTGIVLGREFYVSRDIIKKLKKGDKVYAKIVDLENEDGYIELSLQAADKEIAWKELEKQKEEKIPIKVKILGANKGGLLAEVSGISAFLPSSQLSQEHYPKVENAEPAQIVRELQKLVGKELEVYILDIDPKEEKLILSERVKEIEKIKELLAAYKIGDVVEGTVTGIVDFGCFVTFPPKSKDLEEGKPEGVEEKIVFDEGKAVSIEGLCHISELDWQLVEKPENIVQIGQKVKAKIIKIEEDKVFLSLKALKKNPWEEAALKYKKDDVVRGKVVKLNPFGAFVEVAPNVQGLCHISEFGTKEKMEEALKVGEEYEFIVLQIEPKEHKMGLKLITNNQKTITKQSSIPNNQ